VSTGIATFTAAERARRAEAIRERMRATGVDALLLYAAGRAADIQYLVEWPGTREAFLVFAVAGEPTLLVQFFNHVANARRVATTPDVRWAGAANAAVAEAVAERAPRRLGIVGALPWSLARVVTERTKAELVDFTAELRTIRSVASDEEIEVLREAARVTDLAMHALELRVRPGLQERDLVHVVESAITAAGGTPGIHFMATTPMRAPRIGVPSQIQSPRRIERGDVLITEITAHVRGYGGQIHRAYAIGAEPTPEYEALHEAAVLAFERICATLRDGATVAQVLDAAEVLHERGFTIHDDLLHGTDQLPPILQTRRTARHPQPESFVFRENMVVVVQPNLVSDQTATAGLQVGETVRVTRSGVERLHSYPLRFVRCGGALAER
jgi:Xaa-Pro dipeptidase